MVETDPMEKRDPPGKDIYQQGGANGPTELRAHKTRHVLYDINRDSVVLGNLESNSPTEATQYLTEMATLNTPTQQVPCSLPRFHSGHRWKKMLPPWL